MFGIITDKFLEKTHEAFDELGYHVSSNPNWEDFRSTAVKTLTHTKDLDDAINCVRMFRFCCDEWDKIEKIFEKASDRWNAIPFEGESLISTVSDEEAQGSYFITNGLTKAEKEVDLLSTSYGTQVYSFENKGGKFFLDGFRIQYSHMSSTKMKLFDREVNLLCNVVLSKNLGIFLEKNQTNLELAPDDYGILIFHKDYFDSVSDDESLDSEEVLAEMDWDILDEKTPDAGVTKLTLYKTLSSDEFYQILCLAASSFLLFRSYNKAQSATNAAIIASSTNYCRR